jgi:excisionase family DNA binding protein
MPPSSNKFGRSVPEAADPDRASELPDWLTAAETASYLRLGRSTVYALISEGTIPSVRLGRRVLVPRAGLLSRLAELQI